MSQHLSSNFVEDYRQRRLSPAELVATDIHLAECDTCREMIAHALQLPTRTLGLQADLTSNHASYEQLAAFTDGSYKTLDWSEREFLIAHFKDCASCSADLRDLQLFAATLASYYPPGTLGRSDVIVLPNLQISFLRDHLPEAESVYAWESSTVLESIKFLGTPSSSQNDLSATEHVPHPGSLRKNSRVSGTVATDAV